MSAKAARTGRPLKEAKPGSRASLGLKVTPSIKSRLDEAARTNGRTQSQEAEARLEQSFNREDLLLDVLTLAYDDRLAGLLMAIGETVKSIGPLRHASALHNADGSVTLNFGKWDADEYSKLKALQAVRKFIELIANPDLIEKFEKNVNAGIDEFGDAPYSAVSQSLMALTGRASFANNKRWQTIRALLGPPFSEAK